EEADGPSELRSGATAAAPVRRPPAAVRRGDAGAPALDRVARGRDPDVLPLRWRTRDAQPASLPRGSGLDRLVRRELTVRVREHLRGTRSRAQVDPPGAIPLAH